MIERVGRIVFWCLLFGFAVYGLVAAGRHHAAVVSVAAVVLIVGGIAVLERPRER